MSSELGTLVVVVLKARNLHDKHSFYKQDVYAQITINDTLTKKTGVDVKGGQHPVWDEELRVPILGKASETTRTLLVSCWSKEPRGAEVIGEGKLDISETLRTGEFDDWVSLKVDGIYRGEIYLEMTFYAAGPPSSLSRRPSKLVPKDRLDRPTQAYAYPKTAPSTSGGHLAPPPPLSPPHSPPHKRYDNLPPLPEELDQTPANVPSILRPGRPRSSSPANRQPAPPERVSHDRMPTSPPHSPPFVPPILQPASGAPYASPSLRPDSRARLHAGEVEEDISPFSFPSPHIPDPLHTYHQPGASSRPYPYNYPSPPRYPDLDPNPILSTRHQVPLPLPDEPAGGQTPPSARPQGEITTVTTHHAEPNLKRAHAHSRSRDEDQKKHARDEDRDRLLALAIEHEEEERKKQVVEQEARDMELAKKLDLELNLNLDGTDSDRVDTVLPRINGPNTMPGGW